MESKLFIDANFYCALYNEGDSLHKRCVEITESLIDKYKTYTSSFILLESYTIVSQRSGKPAALKFGKYIRSQQNTKVINVDLDLEQSTWEIFKSVDNKNFSYVDASTIAVIENSGITNLLTFDRHFMPFQKQYKFKVIS